jgi:hypothetical protein
VLSATGIAFRRSESATFEDNGLQNPEEDLTHAPLNATVVESPQTLPQPVAPVWHTIILVVVILGMSIKGASEFSGPSQVHAPRLVTYALTAASELLMLGWIYFGLRLRKIPFRSLFGSIPTDFVSILADAGIAVAFWIGSLFVLGVIGGAWLVIEAAIKHRSLLSGPNAPGPDPSQQTAVHALTQLAPSTAAEVAGWIVLCIVAGLAEEIIFRGYMQRQFAAWSRGSVAVGVVASAVIFGLAHGYQGARNMVMLAIFGAMFSLLAIFRKSLRPGIFAHSWHDAIAGLVIALLRMHHLI